MTSRLQWEGRDVTFIEINMAAGREVLAAAAIDGERGFFMGLVKACRYADTGDPVFKSVDEIDAMPFRLRARLMRLATEAHEANRQEEIEVVDEHGNRVPLS
jgi:DNA-binding NtrC family response regulator